MVAGDDDEGVVRMLLREVHDDAHGAVHGHGLAEAGAGVVGVAVVVDVAALDHDEERLVLQGEEVDALLGVLGEAPLVFGLVDGVREGAVVAADEELVGGLQVDFRDLVAVGHDVAFFLGDLVEVVVAAAVALQAAAAEIFEPGVHEVDADVVVVVAADVVRVERGRGGVVDGDAGEDADGAAVLLRDFRDGFELALALGVHADAAVVGLLAAGDGRAAGGGVGDVVGERAGLGVALLGQGVDGEALAHGGLAELLRQHALRQRHAVADEEEDVLGGFQVLILVGVVLSSDLRRRQREERACREGSK